MLDIVAVASCPLAFAGVLASAFVWKRPLAPRAMVAILAGPGTLATLLPLMARVGERPMSPLASCFGTALGVATVAGAWIAARVLPRG